MGEQFRDLGPEIEGEERKPAIKEDEVFLGNFPLPVKGGEQFHPAEVLRRSGAYASVRPIDALDPDGNVIVNQTGIAVSYKIKRPSEEEALR